MKKYQELLFIIAVESVLLIILSAYSVEEGRQRDEALEGWAESVKIGEELETLYTACLKETKK